VQAEACGCHPGDHDRDAKPEEGDDEDGGDEGTTSSSNASSILRARSLTELSQSPRLVLSMNYCW
jgi:hypothetical protein